jgi:hypothetical protein
MHDSAVVSQARALSPAEVRAADITESPAGEAALRAERKYPESIWSRWQPARVFKFGNQVVITDVTTPLTVIAGLDAQDRQAHEVMPLARPAPRTAPGGYSPPSASTWVANTQGGYTNYFEACGRTDGGPTSGCTLSEMQQGLSWGKVWKREVIWNINANWDQPCYGRTGTCQYFRMYGRIRSSVLTAARFPYARSWIEFATDGNWGGSPSDNFEFPKPEESVAGKADTTKTIGFGANLSVTLGPAPKAVGGGVSGEYKGSVTSSSEWWHPVSRDTVASGGVQYCRYASGWEVARLITTRVGIMQNKNAQMGGWNILLVMQKTSAKCPSV